MTKPLHLLLADDDPDDRYFFDKALASVLFLYELNFVEDGEKLMTYLIEHANHLPDVLFLDLNMPRKNGAECLAEIKVHDQLKHLPVIIYSTSLQEDTAEQLYEAGAHYYIKKTGFTELELILQTVLLALTEQQFTRPLRNQFVFNMVAS